MENTTPESDIKSILVISTNGWTETILTSFVGPALKEKFPQAPITLILRETLSDWARCLYYDDFIFAKESGPLPQLKGFDLVLDLGRGEINEALRLLKENDVVPQRLNFKMKVRQHVHDEVMLKLAHDGIRSQGFVAIAPGAGAIFSHKRWAYFPELVKLILARTSLPILLLGSPDEKSLAPSLIPYDTDRVFSWIGTTTKEEALSAVAESTTFIGGDSGLSHVAASVGVPTVILYGPSPHTKRIPPGHGKNVICLQGSVPCSPCQKSDGAFAWDCRDNVCMKSISPEMVWRSLQHLHKF